MGIDFKGPLFVSLPLLLCFCLGAGVYSPAFAKVQMGVQSRVESSDNIHRDAVDKVSDIIYTLSPWMEMKRRRPRLQMRLGYHPSYTWYEKNREYNLAGHRVDMGARGEVARDFVLSLDGSFDRSEETASGQATIHDPTRRPYSTYTSTISGLWTTGKDENLGGSLFGTDIDYDPKSASQDSHEIGGDVTSRTEVAEHIFGTIDAGYLNGEYDDATGYRQIRGTLGVEYLLNPRRRVFGRFGFSQYTGDSRTHYATWNPTVGMAESFQNGNYDIGAGVLIRDEEGTDTSYRFSVVGNADLKKRGRRGEMGASLSTGYEESYIDSDSPGFDTFVSAGVSGSYGISKRFTLKGSCNLRDDAYKDNRPGESDRNDLTWTLTTGMDHPLTKWATLRLDYTYCTRRSNVDEQEYDENSIALTLNCFTR